jgi:hypothetical protein
MPRALLPAVWTVLLFAAPAAAQDPLAVVRGWYRQFLDRELEPGPSAWVDQLREGKPPDGVLAHIVASPEYYLRSGSTPQGFVRNLFLDLTGREPSPRDLQDWVRRLRTDEDRREVARALLQRYPQAWRPATDPVEGDYLTGVQAAARQLAFEVERFQEDVVVELGGRRERELYRRADDVLGDLRRFQRGLRPGATRGRLYGEFHRLDRQLHDLLEEVRALGRDQRALLRVAARIEQADQQLHYALFRGDTTEDHGSQLLVRQLRALRLEARELERTARYALAGNRPGERLADDLDAFAVAVEHLVKSAETGAGRDHLRRDFAAVDRAWQQVTTSANRLPPLPGTVFLRSRAQQVDNLLDRVYDQLGLRGERPRLLFQPGTGR